MLLELNLTDDQLDALADLVADRLPAKSTPAQPRLVDAQTVADTLGISRDTVYARAIELGGRRIGDGDRPRWRFNLADALNSWQPSGTPARAARRRRPANGTNLLPVHGDER